MKTICTIIIFSMLFLSGCLSKKQKMSIQTKFPYSVSVTAPYEYPVAVHLGYLSAGKNFITSISKNGKENQGWISDGANDGMGGSIIPSFLELTWISYAEKKFWKIEANLPADKILNIFRNGFKRVKNEAILDDTYNQIVIGLAPGGVVVVWLQGVNFRVEIGRYQAKDVVVTPDEFYRNPDEDNQKQFFDAWFNIAVPEDAQKNIKDYGIQYGLWDEYRIKYNWRLHIKFYNNADKELTRYITYFNGESIIFYELDIENNLFKSQAIPCRTTMIFRDKNTEVHFDEKEIFDAFKVLTKTNKDAQIDIVAKVGFMYNGMSFWAESGGEKIPLPKTKVLGMWNNK